MSPAFLEAFCVIVDVRGLWLFDEWVESMDYLRP